MNDDDEPSTARCGVMLVPPVTALAVEPFAQHAEPSFQDSPPAAFSALLVYRPPDVSEQGARNAEALAAVALDATAQQDAVATAESSERAVLARWAAGERVWALRADTAAALRALELACDTARSALAQEQSEARWELAALHTRRIIVVSLAAAAAAKPVASGGSTQETTLLRVSTSTGPSPLPSPAIPRAALRLPDTPTTGEISSSTRHASAAATNSVASLASRIVPGVVSIDAPLAEIDTDSFSEAVDQAAATPAAGAAAKTRSLRPSAVVLVSTPTTNVPPSPTAAATSTGRHASGSGTLAGRHGATGNYSSAAQTSLRLGIREAALPAGWTLLGLPTRIVQEFEMLARRVIRGRFVPYLWARAVKRQRARLSAARKLATNGGDPHVLMRLMRDCSEVLRGWPEAVLLSALAPAAVFRSYRHEEIVFHQGEPASGGISFILSGLCDVVQRDPLLVAAAHARTGPVQTLWHRLTPRAKGLSLSGRMLQLRGPVVVGDFALLNEEPRMAFVVAVGTVDIVTIPRDALLNAFQLLPVATAQQIFVAAHARRTANLPVCFPMTADRVRASPLFHDVQPDGIELILSRLVPVCVPKGRRLCEMGQFAHEMFFLRRGLIGYKDDRGNKVILREGACIGEREFMFRERHPFSVVALSNADLYTLRVSDLEQLTSGHHELRAAIHEAARQKREAELIVSLGVAPSYLPFAPNAGSSVSSPLTSSQQDASPALDAIDEYVRAIPLFSLFATPECRAALRAELRPRVVNTRQVIINASDQCDRLLILTRGVAQLRTHVTAIAAVQHAALPTVSVGECIGYTCLAEHRWTHSIVAVEPVDMWQIERPAYYALLQRFGIYKQVLGATMQMLQPLLPFPFKTTELARIAVALPSPNSFPQLKTPNLHPTHFAERPVLCAPWRPPETVSLEGFGALQSAKDKARQAAAKRNADLREAFASDVAKELALLPSSLALLAPSSSVSGLSSSGNDRKRWSHAAPSAGGGKPLSPRSLNRQSSSMNRQHPRREGAATAGGGAATGTLTSASSPVLQGIGTPVSKVTLRATDTTELESCAVTDVLGNLTRPAVTFPEPLGASVGRSAAGGGMTRSRASSGTSSPLHDRRSASEDDQIDEGSVRSRPASRSTSLAAVFMSTAASAARATSSGEADSAPVAIPLLRANVAGGETSAAANTLRGSQNAEAASGSQPTDDTLPSAALTARLARVRSAGESTLPTSPGFTITGPVPPTTPATTGGRPRSAPSIPSTRSVDVLQRAIERNSARRLAALWQSPSSVPRLLRHTRADQRRPPAWHSEVPIGAPGSLMAAIQWTVPHRASRFEPFGPVVAIVRPALPPCPPTPRIDEDRAAPPAVGSMTRSPGQSSLASSGAAAGAALGAAIGRVPSRPASGGSNRGGRASLADHVRGATPKGHATGLDSLFLWKATGGTGSAEEGTAQAAAANSVVAPRLAQVAAEIGITAVDTLLPC